MKINAFKNILFFISTVIVFTGTINQAYAEWRIATSVVESQNYFFDRKIYLIQKRLDELHKAYSSVSTSVPEVDRWVQAIGNIEEGRAWKSTTLITSGLLAIKEKRRAGYSKYQYTPPEIFVAAVEKWSTSVHTFNAGHIRDGDVGTGGDYDFSIRNMLFLIYSFKSDDSLLTDIALFNIIDKGLSTLAGELGSHDTRLILATIDLLVDEVEVMIPETENHVFMIVGGRHLINQFIIGVLNDLIQNRSGLKNLLVGRKYNLKYRYDAITENTQKPIKDLLLQASGRILHKGFFETNSRPYQGITFHAILNIYSNTNDAQIKTGMQNALDYLSTKYTFQSLNGYRISPMRRNYEYANHVCAFITDDVNEIMSLLNGKYPLRGEDGGAFWTALSSYRIPKLLLDITYDKEIAYQARMQSRFSKNDYGRLGRARYFDSNGVPYYLSKPILPAAELYFRVGSTLNVSGGNYHHYPNLYSDELYDRAASNLINEAIPKEKNSVSAHAFLAVPQTIITEGKIDLTTLGSYPEGCTKLDGRPEPWGNMETLGRNHPVMDGPNQQWWKSNKSGTYKGFSYGSSYRAESGWPQLIPWKWNEYLYRNPSNDSRFNDTWTIGNAKLKIFDFSKNQNGSSNGLPEGVYIIVGAVKRSSVFSLGFWEIVPANKYLVESGLVTDPRVFKSKWMSHNKDIFKTLVDGAYRYTMHTGEVLLLDPNLGFFGIGGNCRNPIEGIIINGETKKLSDYISNRCSDYEIYQHPLLEVKEIQKDTHEFTDKVFAYAKGDGKLIVRNYKFAKNLILDSSDYKNPKRSINTFFVDSDNDSIPNNEDNCPEKKNPGQEDIDGDGLGDICDTDIDGDGVFNREDNCIYDRNRDQKNTDADYHGDACDIDDDNDCVEDVKDNCQFVKNCNYYGDKANRNICKSPCGEMLENQLHELGQLLRDVNISCSINNIDPLCERDGCPWPELMNLENIRIQPQELIRSYVDKFPEEITGIRRLPNNRMSFTANENLLRGGDVTLPGGHNVILLGGNRVLCEENTRRLNDWHMDRSLSQEIRQCVDNLMPEAKQCQLDSDGDGIGDACE